MDLRDYLAVLAKRWSLVVLITLLAVGGAAAATLAATPLYRAETQLFVSVQSGSGNVSELVQGGNFSAQRVKSYADIASSPRVTTPVVEELGLAESPAQLGERIEAEAPLDTVLINLSATDPSPEQAAILANAVAKQFTTVVEEIERPAGGGDSPVKVSVTREAQTPESPESPRTTINLALGLLVGLALGVGLAVLLETLDTSVKDAGDVAETAQVAVLGAIVDDSTAERAPLVTDSDRHSPRAEAFRQLRTNLQFLDVDQAPRTIVVTSSLPGEGKTSTASNLALALAQGGSRVCLVDGDLRRPSVADYFGLVGDAGLTTLLIGRAAVGEMLQPVGSHLQVIASGRIPPNPSELLASQNMHELLRQLQAAFDMVIIDSPPLLPVTDGAVLAAAADGALVVVRRGKTTHEQLARAVDVLRNVDARILGAVLNRVSPKGREAEAYGYAYTYRPERRDRRRSRAHEREDSRL